MTPTAARLVAGAVCALVAAPVAAGLAGVLGPAFGYLPALGQDRLTLAAFAELARAPGLARSVALAAATGLLATVLSLALAAAILAAAFGTRALGRAERLLAPLLAVPHAAAALGLAVLFAPSGLLLRLFSPWATGLEAPPDVAILRDPWGGSLIAALVLKEVPFLFLMALAALAQTAARERVELARSLGYGRMSAFLHAVWPLVYRQIRLPTLAVLAFSASVVDVALILGPTQPAPLAVRVVEWLQSPRLDAWTTGSAAAVLMLATVAALIALWLVLERLVGRAVGALRLSGLRLAADRTVRLALLSVATVGAVLAFASFAGLLLTASAGYWPFPETLPEKLDFSAWSARGGHLAAVVADTLKVALGATLLALPAAVALAEAERHGAGPSYVIYAPLIVPQVAFLFGLTTLAIAAGLAPGLLSVTLAHAVFALPYALIALSGPWRALDARYEMVAATLGRGYLARLATVRLPLLAGPLCVAAALCVAVSVALYLPTQMLGAGRVVTVTTEAVTAAAGGDRRLAAVYATLQLALPFLAFTLARLGPRWALGRRGVPTARGSQHGAVVR